MAKDPSRPDDRSDGDSAEVRQAHTSGGKSMDASIARDLSEIARELQAETDVPAIMQRIVDAAVAEIDAATGAAITLITRGVVSSPAHSSAQAAQVGLAQSETGEGPCVDTSREELTVLVDDLREDGRWPQFAPRAVEAGIVSILSIQLFVEGDNMGALDIYADQPHAFDDEAENVGLLLGSHAAIALSAGRTEANLRAAVGTRDVIGQAKGILMERYRIRGDQAFDLLVVSSQNTNRKLRDVADALIATGELPVPDRRR